jgi:DNA-binding XRE family transcriptional regulator
VHAFKTTSGFSTVTARIPTFLFLGIGNVTPETLVTLRTLAGLTQSGLASALGIHRVTVARWETGKAPIPKWVELAIRSLI